MLVIRLKPTGKKKRIAYRIVVMERRSKYNGRSTDDLGYYNPCIKPEEFKIDKKKMDQWIEQGAQISDGLKTLLEKFT